MDAKLKIKWVKALRSKKYKQGYEALCGETGALCCIGVGAVVLVKGYKPKPTNATFEAASMIGLDDYQQDVLVRMNDDEKKSFEEIADYIEANL